jgi:DNA mismatch repair ATPase MutS
VRAFLMYKDENFDLQRPSAQNESSLTKDLDLTTLFDAMACGDEFLFEVAQKAVLRSLTDAAAIMYRQHILRDCLNNQDVVREIYSLTIEALDRERTASLFIRSNSSPDMVLHASLDVLQSFVDILHRLRSLADGNAGRFASEGFKRMFRMLQDELSDDYFAVIRKHLNALKFRDGVLISSRLGRGNKGVDFVLRRKRNEKKGLVHRIFEKKPAGFTFTIAERDIRGAQVLSELSNRGISSVANVLARSADNIHSFFTMLRTELAFYVGCLNLHVRLGRKGAPVCFPRPVSSDERVHSFEELGDICLALRIEEEAVGNRSEADGKNLVLITGANQGGKSTFLRSIGLAQLMMQSGMFVQAESFKANICAGLFTHFRRREDVAMESGKLDEELGRMSWIVDHLTGDSLVLFNESFAATNEREGSEIARQIVTALLEKGVKVFFVTHLYEFSQGMYEGREADVLFLRAERKADGSRTFKLAEGKPLETSFGEDLYREIFTVEESLRSR